LGKPIIAYSIELALQSELFDAVMVSTDDEKIAEIALKYGAKIPFFRSKENARDEATTVSVLLEVLKKYEKSGIYFGSGCCFYPTAPLLKKESLVAGKNLFDSGFDTVFTAVKFSAPILRALTITKEGKSNMKWPEFQNSRSQDLESFYHDASQFYWFKSNAIEKHQKLFTENTGALILPDTMVQDIDNETDCQLAELKARING